MILTQDNFRVPPFENKRIQATRKNDCEWVWSQICSWKFFEPAKVSFFLEKGVGLIELRNACTIYYYNFW